VTVILRRWSPDDGPLLAEGARAAYIAKIEQLERTDALDLRVADRWAWVVALDGDPVGAIGAAARHVPRMAELGYWVVPRARGCGVAKAAVAQAVGLLFADGVERIQATVEPWNEASRRTLEGAGFTREGLLRGYIAYPGEPRGDVYLYALLSES